MKVSELRKSFEAPLAAGLVTTEEVNEKIAKAVAAGTIDNDDVPAQADVVDVNDVPEASLVKALDAAAEGWALSKAECKTEDKNEDGDKDEDADAGDGEALSYEPDEDDKETEPDEDDKPEPDMKKSFGIDAEDAAVLLAKAVGAEVETKTLPLEEMLTKAFAKIDALANRLESLGDITYAMAEAQRFNMAKGQTPVTVQAPPAPAPIVSVDPDITARLDRIEKAIRAPVGGYRGVYDASQFEAIAHPGDANGSQLAKASVNANYVQEQLLEMRKAALSRNESGMAERLHKSITTLQYSPHLAAAVAAEYGDQIRV